MKHRKVLARSYHKYHKCTLASRMLSDISSLCILPESSPNLCEENRVKAKPRIKLNNISNPLNILYH